MIGSVFFLGGLLETVIKVESPEWFLIIPYHLTLQPYNLLGSALTSIGLVLLCLGLALSIHSTRERMIYKGNTKSTRHRRGKNKNCKEKRLN
jgi:hypothetical protein